MGKAERNFQREERRRSQQFQAEQAQIERDYQTKMWNETNAYNSAVNQRARLEEAGLNPYLMMDGGDAGSAQSVSGVNPPSGASPSVSGSQAQEIISGISSVQDAVNSFYDNMQKSATTQEIQYSNYFKNPETYGRDRWAAETLKEFGNNLGFMSNETADRIIGSKGHSRWAKAYNAEVLDNAIKSQELGNQNMNLQNQMVQANLVQVNLTSDAQKTINKYLDQQEYTKLNIASAAYTEMVARGQLTYEQWRGKIIENLDSRLSYRIKDSIANEFIRASCSAYRMQCAMSDYQFSDIYDADGKKTGKKYYQESMKADLNNKLLHGKSLDRNYGWLDFTSGAGNLLGGFGSAAGGLSNIMKVEKMLPAPKKIRTSTRRYDREDNYQGEVIQTYDYD